MAFHFVFSNPIIHATMFGTKPFGTRFGLLCLCFIISTFIANGQSNLKKEALHEITLFLIPSLYPLNWENPATLFNTTQSCILKSIIIPDKYILGHLIVRINTPQLEQPLFMGVVSAKEKELINLAFKQKVGLGILGVVTKGRLETEAELKRKLEAYKERKMVAFVTYRINDKAMQRILQFVYHFTKKKNGKTAPSDFYSDAFWPRYHNEGAGATAIGVAMLDVVNLLTTETDEWKMQVNIPMSIIGGELNGRKKVDNSTIKNTLAWHNGNGKANVDYVPFEIYEPTVMYKWILEKRKPGNNHWKTIEMDGIPGLYSDTRKIIPDTFDTIFKDRPVPNYFIEHSYFKD